MKLGSLLCALALSATSASADWATFSFAPVVDPGDDPYPLILDGLDGVVSAYEGGFSPADDGVLTLGGDSMTELRAGALGVFADLMRAAALDAAAMSGAKLSAPDFTPLLSIDGGLYYPVFWSNPPELGSAPAVKVCKGAFSYAVLAKRAYGTASLRSNASRPGASRSNMIDRLSFLITHEIVHGIQGSGFDPCAGGRPQPWLAEGMADGVAAYLTERRRPGFLERDPKQHRNDRRYDLPLHDGGWRTNAFGRPNAFGSRLNYDTGSFFRYLIEASEPDGGTGLGVMVEVNKMPPSAATSDDGIYEHLDKAIRNTSGGRGLYRVLPEFMTEYASYGGRRYKKMTGGGALTREWWIRRNFAGCVEVDIEPHVSRVINVGIQAMAAECIEVRWSGFEAPSAVQFKFDDAGDQQGDFHLGEAAWKEGGKWKHCWDSVKDKKPRLGLEMSKKCIMKRGTAEMGGTGGTKNTVTWTSNEEIEGEGRGFYIVTNIAHNFTKTRDANLQMIVGATTLTSNNGQEVKAPNPAAPPVQNGRTDLDGRVSAIATVEGGNVLDGRFIDEDPSAWVPGSVTESAPPGGGAMTLVLSKDYWVGFFGNGRSRPLDGDAAVIIKEPERLQNTAPMAMALRPPIMSGGTMGIEIPDRCGYEPGATIRILEDSRRQLTVRVSGDLFDPLKAMESTGPGCNDIDRSFVERADFTITLPAGQIYSGEANLSAANPPGQSVYRQEFPDGPTFGGIATSATLSAVPADGHLGTDPKGAGTGTSAGGGGAIPSCTCACGSPAAAPGGDCAAVCAPVLASCPPVTADLRGMLESALGSADLPPRARDAILKDVDRMSPETQARIRELIVGE